LYQRKLEITKNNNDLNDKSKVIKDWDWAAHEKRTKTQQLS
jgi:hypothetical protein